MSKRKQPTDENENVPHPRYGASPISSGEGLSPKQVTAAYWQYRIAEIYPETAIRANTSKQNFTIFPREFYVDIQKRCKECCRPFIFFAREQKFWYEELGRYIDVDCLDCFECRQRKRAAKQHREVFSRLIKTPPSDVRDLTQLLESGVYLWRIGELKNIHTLRRLRNIAIVEVPSLAVRQELDELVNEHREDAADD